MNPSYDRSSPGEKNIADWLVEWGKTHQFEVITQPVTPDRFNVILVLDSGRPGPHLMFNGHTDTVSVEGMTIDPFAGEIIDGRLYGRGAADMKGPLACMMAALLRLKDCTSWNGKISLSAVVDEEYRFLGIRKLLENGEPVNFAIVGEPTMLQVIRGFKGCLRFAVTTHGQAAHSSRPNEGASAITAMARVIPELEGYFARRLESITWPEFGSSTGSIGLIQGGTGVNIVPDQCAIQVDVRLLPGQDGYVVHREVNELITMVSLPPGTYATLSEPGLVDPAFELPADHPFVQTLLATLNLSKASVAWFSCDASKIAAKGIPCVVFGPGSIQEAHTARESISLDELESGTEAYVRIAKALLK
ncbi:M20 family metallopeptidase [bacterium]|nr:M20 family metallopeptidase [bacterium]